MMKFLKSLMVIIVLALVGFGIYFLMPKNNDTGQQNDTSNKEEQFNNSGQAKAILDDTDMWKIYEDKNAGFSIKYPGDVNFNYENNSGTYSLSVSADKVDGLEGTMGFNQETAEKNIVSLQDKEYGQSVDWPLEVSKEVVNLGPVSAQKFMVLSRFEICDVTFIRELYFFHDGYQIIVSLSVPKEQIVDTMPEYFTTNQENCQDEKIWNFDKQTDFYNALKNNTGSEIANNWFSLFDKIAGTIEFSDQPIIKSELLQGKWVSLDDAKSEVQFDGSKVIDYYDGENLSDGTFVIQNASHLIETINGEKFEYTITELSNTNLTLIYLGRGNILRYQRKN